MSEEKQVVVPKTPEEQLMKLIQDTCRYFVSLKRFVKPKSHPLYALWRDGELDFRTVMIEIENIRLKKSKLPKSKREAVVALVGTAIEQFQKSQATNNVAERETAQDEDIENKKEGNG